MTSLLQLIADLTNEAQQKDILKNFASVNKLLNNLREQSGWGHSNGCSCNNGRGKGSGGAGRGTLLGNQGSTKDALNKYRWCK